MTPADPLISVVVPARDEALPRPLPRLHRGAALAGRPRLEVVVVENGSRDRTRAVAETWAARDPRITVVVSGATNQAEAMNDGVQAARGAIVARVDAHGTIDDDYLGEVAAAYARHPEAAVVGGTFLPVGETLRERVAGFARSSRLAIGSGYGADRAAWDHPVRTVQCGAYRREALLAAGGFDPAMTYGEDDELHWRLIQRGQAVILCPALRQRYRPRATLTGLWTQYWNYGRGRLRVLRKHPGFSPRGTSRPQRSSSHWAVWAPRAPPCRRRSRCSHWSRPRGAPSSWHRLASRAVPACASGCCCPWPSRACTWRTARACSARQSRGALPSRRRFPPRPRGRPPGRDLPTVSVVICTKDRPAALTECLASLARQTCPAREVIVVDASTAPAEPRGLPASTVRLRSAPGLPRQRNLGARAASGDVVLFLDDDVVLEPGYLAAIARVYAEDAAGVVGGVGGAQVPDPTPRESWPRRAFCRVFLLSGYGRGVVKRSGRVEYAPSPRRQMTVEFLSGCNMSFRRAVLWTYAFDERLTGYALGEDLQFSYRVSREWRLVVTPDARLEHRHAAGGRPAGDEFRAMAVFNKYLFVRECVARGPLDWLAYAWAGLGDALLRLRAPRTRGLRGLVRGYRLVWRHLISGELPASHAGGAADLPAAAASHAIPAAQAGGG